MRPSRLVVLALVVIGLGAWIYFVERHKPTTDELKERADKLFPSFKTESAERIVINNSHGTFELAKEHDAWRLLKPIADDANSGAVSSLLASLSGLRAERTLDPKEIKLADYGLTAPKLALTVTDKGGTSVTVKLGDELPLGDERAAVTDGRKVYLVSKYFASDLDRDLAGWRSTELTSVMSSDVASLAIRGAGGRVALAHAGANWSLTEPIADLADRERAESVVSDLNAAHIKEFLDNPGDLAALGLANPRLEITVVRKDNKPPLQLAFGNERKVKESQQVACKRGERVFWVDSSATAHASVAPADWRSKKLLALDSWAATKLDLEAGGQKISLEQKDGTWKAGGAEADGEEIMRRLEDLADLQVVTFDRPKPSGPQLGRVTVTTGDAKVEATFYPGGVSGEDVAIVPGRAGALGVDAAKVRQVLANPAALAKPKPTPTVAPTANATTAATPTPAVPVTPLPN